MIVDVKRGDFVSIALSGAYPAVAHGCNAFCTMGKGIALPLKQKVPGLYAADCTTIKGDRTKLGTYTSVIHKDVLFINAYTQYTYWNPKDMLSMPAIRDVFNLLNTKLPGQNITKLAIPAIGAGLARGNWLNIVEVINEVTPNLEITVIIWDKETDPRLSEWAANFKYKA